MMTLYTIWDLKNYKTIVADLQEKLLQAENTLKKGNYNKEKTHEVFSAEVVVYNNEVEVWLEVYKHAAVLRLKLLRAVGVFQDDSVRIKYANMLWGLEK